MAKKAGNKKGKSKKDNSQVLTVAKVDKMINKKINEKVESKHAFGQLPYTLFNSGITTVAEMYQAIPNITRGTNDNERIGDQLYGQKLNIRGYMRLIPNTSATSKYSNVLARLFCVSLKTKGNYTEATSSTVPLTALLKKGGTTSAFNGTIADIWAPVNTDMWTVHEDKKFYLSQDQIVQFGTASNTYVSAATKDTVKFFNFNIPCKKVMKYDSNISSGLLPTNFGPMILLGYAYLNGDSADVGDTKVAMAYDISFTYEDA